MTLSSDIRRYLMSAYSDEELVTLCFDDFRDVHDAFSEVMSKGQKILRLLDYCQHRDQFSNLLAVLKRDRPDQFQVRLPDDESGGGGNAVHHNLKREPLYFFGYGKVLESLVQELLEESPVIILWGFGGIGKSTLAKKVAYHYLRKNTFEMIVWVDARRYQETQQINLSAVLDEIARVYDSNSVIVQLGNLQQKTREVIRLLSQHDTLVIFDNFESILRDREGAAICDFINQLPLAVPDGASDTASIVRVIMTTRELSEDLERLQPRIHPVEALNADDIRRLVERMLKDRSIPPKPGDNYLKLHEFTYGIPKLIELAVPQLRYFSIDDILRGFKPHPHPGGSDEIYTYLFRRTWEKILIGAQKRILMGMTFFVEHAPGEAVAATAGISAVEFAECIKGLCDMSLLDVDHPDDNAVYRIHPLTQSMSEAQLGEEPDFARSAKKRFVEFYLQYSRSNYRANQTLMAREIKNIMAAIETARQLAEWQLLIDFRDPLNHFMWLAGYWPERVTANKNILHACRQVANKPLEARVLVEDLGFTYLRFEDLESAQKYVREGLGLYRQLGDERGIALATRHLGKSALLKGEYELLEPKYDWQHYFKQARTLYTDSLKIRKCLSKNDSKEEVAVADLELDFGRLYWLWGRKCERDGRKNCNPELISQAIEFYNKAINASERGKDIFEKHQNPRGHAKALGNLGNAIKQKGRFFLQDDQLSLAKTEFTRAQSLYEKSLEIAQSINKMDEVAHAKWGLAEICELKSDILEGDAKSLDLALSLADDSNRLYRGMATPADIQETQKLLERLRSKRKQMSD